jgi:uncharacterized membrane protein
MNQRTAGYSPETSAQLPFGPKTLLLGASALVLYGLTRRSAPGVALATAGGVLAFKAATYQPSAQRTKATFLVSASPEKAYDLWRNFENLPRFMAHLQSVSVLDEIRSEWVARGPGHSEIRWLAEIVEDRRNRRITWQSLSRNDVSGYVEFRGDPLGRGTFVTAEVRYDGGGPVARALATLLGKHPEFMVREDLRRFKALLETGETPTTVGQTHGPRGIHGHAEEFLFRETSNLPQPQARGRYARSA